MHPDGSEFLGEAMDDIEDEGAVNHRLTEIARSERASAMILKHRQ